MYTADFIFLFLLSHLLSISSFVFLTQAMDEMDEEVNEKDNTISKLQQQVTMWKLNSI